MPIGSAKASILYGELADVDVPFQLAALASLEDAGISSSITTPSFTPPANSLCIVASCCRRDGARTLALPSATHSMDGSWTLADDEYTDNGSNLYIGTQIAYRFFGSSPGSGTVTQTITSSTAYQMATAVLTVVGADETPLIRSGSANGTGASLAIPYTNATAPPTSMQGIVCIGAAASVTDTMAISGYTRLANIQMGGPYVFDVFAKLGSVANSATVSGVGSVLATGVNIGIAD